MSKGSQVAMTALALVGAVFLIGLSVPRTIAAWRALEAEPTLAKLQIGESPAPQELAVAAAALSSAQAWSSTGRRLSDLALLEMVQATHFFPRDAKRAELLGSAEQHLIAGLAAGPGDGFAWFRLARVRDLKSAPPRQVVVALMQSLDMAPNAYPLWIPRSELFLLYRDALNEDERLALYTQLRTIWRYGAGVRGDLFSVALGTGGLPGIVEALGHDPEAQAQYKSLMEELARRRPAK